MEWSSTIIGIVASLVPQAPRAGFVLGIPDAGLGADEWAQRPWSWDLGLRSLLSDLTILFFPPKNSPPPPPTFTIEAIILTSFWYLSF